MAVAVAIVATPASAQTGQVKGKVVDTKGQPVEGAKITLLNQQTNRTLETKTNKKGEYIQVGLAPGKYRITASKDSLSDTVDVDIRLEMATHDFTLGAGRGGGGGMSKEEVAKAKAKAEAATKTFNEGVALSNEGKGDEAIAKFNEVIASMPNCVECYANIGTVQTRVRKYDEAEAAFKKAIELKPDFAEAYNGLANLYNAQKKFDQAAEASKKAMELGGAAGAGAAGGSASSVFNQGVILWNAGKIPEAKAQFEQAVKLDPNMPDAQYWLGMALLNSGDTASAKPKFEAYLKLAPTGQYAETAKSIVATIK
ncbi:MAG TPA: tetratricopeptide repeat protein [Vicinamibacterales bacterium]|nr:tetratricopeptide repeat protein [Vicinamibacterales bacterium]